MTQSWRETSVNDVMFHAADECQCDRLHLLLSYVNFIQCLLTKLQMTQVSCLPVNKKGQPDFGNEEVEI